MIHEKLKAVVKFGELTAVENEKTPDEYRMYIQRAESKKCLKKRGKAMITEAGNQSAKKNLFNFAFIDENTKREIRRKILKAVAIPGYQSSPLHPVNYQLLGAGELGAYR